MPVIGYLIERVGSLLASLLVLSLASMQMTQERFTRQEIGSVKRMFHRMAICCGLMITVRSCDMQEVYGLFPFHGFSEFLGLNIAGWYTCYLPPLPSSLTIIIFDSHRLILCDMKMWLGNVIVMMNRLVGMAAGFLYNIIDVQYKFARRASPTILKWAFGASSALHYVFLNIFAILSCAHDSVSSRYDHDEEGGSEPSMNVAD
jgi:hypothetical protein